MHSLFILSGFGILAQLTSTNAATSAKAGPFDVVFRRASTCPGSLAGQNLIRFETKLRRVSRIYSIVEANASINIEVNDEIMGSLKLAVKTNQGWKDNFFNLDAGPACTNLKRFVPSFFSNVLREVKQNDCPIPVGNYSNMVFDLNVTVEALKIMFFNDYRGRIFGKFKGNTIFCLEFYCSVVPKKSG